MEDVLAIYEKPLCDSQPVVCVDEKPVVLHADVRAPRRQCLGKRRIPALKDLQHEARVWNRKMNQDHTKINWQFTRQKARQKFHYGRTDFMRSET